MTDKLDCEVENCTWSSRDSATLEQAIQLLHMHNTIKHGDLFGAAQ